MPDRSMVDHLMAVSDAEGRRDAEVVDAKLVIPALGAGPLRPSPRH